MEAIISENTHFDEKRLGEIAALIINMNLWTCLKLAHDATPAEKA